MAAFKIGSSHLGSDHSIAIQSMAGLSLAFEGFVGLPGSFGGVSLSDRHLSDVSAC